MRCLFAVLPVIPATPALAGKVCQEYAESAPPGTSRDCRNLPADTSYEVYRNGQEWAGSFPILDVAKGYIESDDSTDCFTIKEVPACVWGDGDE
jgi:hypothetical protein